MFHVERRSVRYAVRRSAGRYPRLGWRIMIRLVAIVLVACWVVSVRLLVDIGAAGCRVDIVPLLMSRIVYRLAFIVLVAVDAVARGLMAAGVRCVAWLVDIRLALGCVLCARHCAGRAVGCVWSVSLCLLLAVRRAWGLCCSDIRALLFVSCLLFLSLWSVRWMRRALMLVMRLIR